MSSFTPTPTPYLTYRDALTDFESIVAILRSRISTHQPRASIAAAHQELLRAIAPLCVAYEAYANDDVSQRRVNWAAEFESHMMSCSKTPENHSVGYYTHTNTSQSEVRENKMPDIVKCDSNKLQVDSGATLALINDELRSLDLRGKDLLHRREVLNAIGSSLSAQELYEMSAIKQRIDALNTKAATLLGLNNA